MASGKVYIKYPGMMRWEYEKPDRQIIITDADKLWIYRPEDNQVMTGKAPTFFRDGKGASFLSDIRLIRQKFDISLEQDPEQGAKRSVLSSKVGTPRKNNGYLNDSPDGIQTDF